jgi:hypothetical protein
MICLQKERDGIDHIINLEFHKEEGIKYEHTPARMPVRNATNVAILVHPAPLSAIFKMEHEHVCEHGV